MLIDEITITVAAGHGGAGKVSFGNGPDGGNGGRGGSVWLTVTSDLKALNQFSGNPVVTAPNGIPGGKHTLAGKAGADIWLALPIGTFITNLESDETLELISLDQKILLCPGGKGGLGNSEFKTSKNRSPDYAQPGLPGQSKTLKLVLKFIAQYGLVGLPNAGKSSLLNELTNANALVGAYPFTTLEANLGAFGTKVIADIPGLIAGASTGRGLGIKFLKHIEKVSMLLHCISAESKDVIGDYYTINTELESYNTSLLSKDRLILLTKTDLVDNTTLNNQIKLLKKLKFPIFPVSIHDLDSIEKLKLAL